MHCSSLWVVVRYTSPVAAIDDDRVRRRAAARPLLVFLIEQTRTSTTPMSAPAAPPTRAVVFASPHAALSDLTRCARLVGTTPRIASRGNGGGLVMDGSTGLRVLNCNRLTGTVQVWWWIADRRCCV